MSLLTVEKVVKVEQSRVYYKRSVSSVLITKCLVYKHRQTHSRLIIIAHKINLLFSCLEHFKNATKWLYLLVNFFFNRYLTFALSYYSIRINTVFDLSIVNVLILKTFVLFILDNDHSLTVYELVVFKRAIENNNDFLYLLIKNLLVKV